MRLAIASRTKASVSCLMVRGSIVGAVHGRDGEACWDREVADSALEQSGFEPLVPPPNIDLNGADRSLEDITRLRGYRGYAASDIFRMQQRSGSVTMSSFSLVSATG